MNYLVLKKQGLFMHQVVIRKKCRPTDFFLFHRDSRPEMNRTSFLYPAESRLQVILPTEEESGIRLLSTAR